MGGRGILGQAYRVASGNKSFGDAMFKKAFPKSGGNGGSSGY